MRNSVNSAVLQAVHLWRCQSACLFPQQARWVHLHKIVLLMVDILPSLWVCFVALPGFAGISESLSCWRVTMQ